MSDGSMAGTTQLWKSNDQMANKNGNHATVYWSNKNTYVGTWKDNKKDGRGQYTNKAKGVRYEGEFKTGERHGRGVLWKTEKGGRFRRVYEGEWQNNKRSGQGTFYYESGDTYTGSWSDNRRSGHGTLSYQNGDFYEGDFLDDKRHGYGVVINESGDRYEGNWAGDLKEGPGVYYYVAKRQVYRGEWRLDVAKCGELEEMQDLGPADAAATRAGLNPDGFQFPALELMPQMDADGNEIPGSVVVLGSRVNTLRIERAASTLKGQPVSRDAFTLAQLNSLEKGFKIVDQAGAGIIPAFQLADVFGQFGAELGQEECLALLSAIDVTDETTALTFDDFLKCMAVLVNA